MRIVLLSFLLFLGLIGCASVAKETGKGIIHTVSEELSEYNLSEATEEALAIGATNGTSAFTYVGLALFAIGAVSFAFLARDAGLKLMACGALAGAIPFVVESAYFSIIVSGALLLSLLIAIYHLWWKVRQNQNAEEEQKP
jgi:ABC-type uncharacterized transport system permease subunit